MAISNDNAVRIAEIERIENGKLNLDKLVDTISHEYKQMLKLALDSVEVYAKENGLSAKEKKALEDLQKINARRYYLQARNQENARNGGFFAKRDIEMNNREIRALNGVYSEKLNNGLKNHMAGVDKVMTQMMNNKSKKTTPSTKRAA
jgi:Ser/Thr protein kinase RdoA (MazF antagonist)